jgi:hypothetical protein
VTALTRMRLYAYLRTGRFVAPVLTCLVVIGIYYGGGGSEPVGQAYGVNAMLLFPVLAWQAKLLLDVEPEVQRRLARVAVGSTARDLGAGIAAAVLAAFPLIVLSLVAPWLLGGVRGPISPGEPTLAAGLTVGLWAHLVVIAPAVLLGAWASRAITRTFGLGAIVLVGGAVLTLVLGLTGSPLWWVAPPMLSITRTTTHGLVPAGVALVTLHALMWTVVALAGYGRVRRVRI